MNITKNTAKFLKSLTALSVSILLNVQSAACADDTDVPRTNASSSLSKIDLFAMGNIGFVGYKSDGEKLYEEILGKENANGIFVAILEDKNSTMAAKLYALCGLKKGSSPSYKNEKNKLLGSDTEVSTMTADVMRKESSKELVKKIDRYWCKKN